jgi:hypothetical protein
MLILLGAKVKRKSRKWDTFMQRYLGCETQWKRLFLRKFSRSDVEPLEHFSPRLRHRSLSAKRHHCRECRRCWRSPQGIQLAANGALMRRPFTFALMLSLGALCAVCTVSKEAKAKPVPSVDWMRLLTDLDSFARGGANVIDSPRCTTAGCQTDTNATAAAPERLADPHGAASRDAWFTVAPTFSLVARDWNSAQKLAGDRLAIVDAVRLTSSTRMVLTRVRASNARIAPFAQVGLGQWRTDPYLLPRTPRYTEFAAQAGTGIEARIGKTWQIVVETTMTMLCRDGHQAEMPSTHIWGTTLASSVEF